ncbi:LOW QUALITY PROTEIN: sprT-like domain-containing protein Spartan [Chelonus insularis]|uniref:LOW QUALITY PROTEIN: sprT-like domain-containing protein Spartan n=1 Tax=Chelonus insularis TaxID=460826 RepID=UPI00158C7E8A|nr:LOW QUALITY PROTEIN: sprT-like domain-containing protein Spartan [Chelonus insularis]
MIKSRINKVENVLTLRLSTLLSGKCFNIFTMARFAIEQDLNGITKNAVFPTHINEFNYRPRTLVDETLETIDPTPDVHGMFVQFNKLFFWETLNTVYVKWSTRMTTCAGTCTFKPRNHECVIALSAPLLKLRPRKDLVETLLHEMIHAYLFVTNNNRDRDGHGPEFCKHMNRINQSAGTKITIYHSFHDEVRLYQQHWWKCDGPCKNKPPYFGTVRRAMNRAPGPTDFWWSEHQANCGGKFIKIREPEKPKARSKSTSNSKTNSPSNTNIPKSKQTPKRLPNQNTLDGFITSSKANSPFIPVVPFKPIDVNRINSIKTPVQVNSFEGLKKLGNSTNNVYGFGTGGPGSTSSQPTTNKPSSKRSSSLVNFTATVGGNNLGKSRLLDLYSSTSSKKEVPVSVNTNNTNSTKCPICNELVTEDINNHIDRCLSRETPLKRQKIEITSESNHECPICGEKFPQDQINIHIDLCLPDENNKSLSLKDSTTIMESTRRESVNPHRKPTLPRCPICNEVFNEDVINDHVDICLFERATGENLRSQITNTTSQSDLPSSAGRAQSLETIDLTDSSTPSSSHMNCYTCNKNIDALDYYSHVQECLAKLQCKKTQSDEIIEIDDNASDRSERSGGSSSLYKCLVCNEMISKNIPLEEHLESCVQVPYSCSSSDSLEEVDEDCEFVDNTIQSPNSSDKKQLCPICMELFSERLIVSHVDQCVNFKI